MLNNVIGGFPYDSIWLSSGAASHDIHARGCVNMAEEFFFKVGAIMASDDAVAMQPTVAGRIEVCRPCLPMEWWPLYARCCGRRSNSGRGGGRADGWFSVEFGYQRCVGC